MDKATLWMGDLDPWMTEEWIRQVFLSYGFLVSVKMIRDKTTGYGRSY